MHVSCLSIVVLVISSITLCPAYHTSKDSEAAPQRGFGIFSSFPKWTTDIEDLTDFKDHDFNIPGFKDLLDFKDLHDFGDMHGIKEDTGFKDIHDFKDLFSYQRIPNTGKDLTGEESKPEVYFQYHGDYGYDYYQEDNYSDEDYPTNDDKEGEDDYDLSSLSFLAKEKLKNVGSIEEVARITGLALLDDQQSSPTASANSALRMRSGHTRGKLPGTHNGPKHAMRATCEPEKVSIPLEAEEGYRVIPTCTRLKRCGGCCNRGMECVATKTKPVELKVLEISHVNDSMRWRTLLNVTEDEECGCQCSVKESDCLPTQDYDEASCSCICKAGLEEVKRECEENRRLWDPYQCQCQCPMYTPRSDADCGSGQKFNSLACSCEND